MNLSLSLFCLVLVKHSPQYGVSLVREVGTTDLKLFQLLMLSLTIVPNLQTKLILEQIFAQRLNISQSSFSHWPFKSLTALSKKNWPNSQSIQGRKWKHYFSFYAFISQQYLTTPSCWFRRRWFNTSLMQDPNVPLYLPRVTVPRVYIC